MLKVEIHISLHHSETEKCISNVKVKEEASALTCQHQEY
jgi:hypothetical protein